MSLDLEKTDDPVAENARLRALLSAAEAHASVRFVLLDLGDERLVLTTSRNDDAPTPYERRVLACFAKPWADSQAAYTLGFARGIQIVAEAAYRGAKEAWPVSLRKAYDKAVERATHASIMSIDLTRIALAPLGLVATEADDMVMWRRDEKAEVPHAG